MALVALVAIAPVMLAIALAVKLTSPGPAIFRQRRVGRDGRVFDVLKFRTMTLTPAPVGEGTDRRTRVGRWLRSSSLEELPQLINVLRGEMSLVGPRPERPEFAEQLSRDVDGYEDRHRVKSGITGWAQVNGLRAQTSIADRVEWDNHYVENWSLELELRTIALTLAQVMRFRDEDPERRKRPAQPQLEPVEKPALELVELAAQQVSAQEASTAVWFCGYCGATPTSVGAPAPIARVCGSCGQGLMLESGSDAAPRVDEPFLVVDSRLTVQAVSQHDEQILGVSEQQVTDRPVAELLVGADAELGADESLTSILSAAANAGEHPRSTFVRPRSTFGVRLRARISACGPPRAALIVFEATPPAGPRPTHLRLVPADVREAKSA